MYVCICRAPPAQFGHTPFGGEGMVGLARGVPKAGLSLSEAHVWSHAETL